MRYSLPDSLLTIIIKDSFTENLYPSQAFLSDEMKKAKRIKLCRMFFSHENALYQKGGAIIINSYRWEIELICAVHIYDEVF